MGGSIAPQPQQTLRRVRAVLLAVLLLGIGGSISELLLIDHIEEWKQIIPLAVMGLVLVALGWMAFSRTPTAIWLVRIALFLMAVAGGAGVALHFLANNEFQTELDPGIGRWDLFWKSIRATAPPALAPGVMIQLALVGWAYTLGHPALDRARREQTGENP